MQGEYPKGSQSSSHTVENERIAGDAAPQSQHVGNFQLDEPPCLLFSIYIVADAYSERSSQGIRIGSDGGSETARGAFVHSSEAGGGWLCPFSVGTGVSYERENMQTTQLDLFDFSKSFSHFAQGPAHSESHAGVRTTTEPS